MSPSLLALLAACGSDYELRSDRVAGELVLTLTSPTYGQFMGDEDVTVAGTVWPRQARVTVEGEAVELDEAGAFTVRVPVGHAWRNIDVEASLDTQVARERVPVFSGHDPRETWPGGMTGRLLPAGLTKLGENLGAAIDASGWAEQIAAALPSVETDVVDIVPVGVTHEPTVVELTPAEEGIEAAVTLNDLVVEYELRIDWLGYSTTMSAGWGQVAIGGLLVPSLDEDRVVWLTMTEARIDLDEAEVQFGAIDSWIIEWIVDGLNDLIVEPLGELLLDWVLAEYGVIEVGGPFAFESDLLGTPVAAALFDLYGDLEGLGLEVGIGLGEPAPTDALSIPTPDISTPGAADAHLALAVHEGLFHLLVGDVLLGYLSQDLDLAGSYGDLIGNGIVALPGGDQAPEADGWCLSLDPGSAHVTRLQEGVDPLAVVYLPDFVVNVGTMQGTTCEDWLVASLAVEIGLTLDGTALDLDLEVPEGVVLYYGAEGVDEAEVIEGLGSWVSGMMGLLGGMLDLDLGDLLGGIDSGGLLGELSPRVIESAKMIDENGEWPEGLYALSIDLWE